MRTAAVALLLLGGWAWFVNGEETELVGKVLATLLLPGMLAGLALWIWLVHRRTPKRQRLTLWRDRVRYDDPQGSWEQRMGPAWASDADCVGPRQATARRLLCGRDRAPLQHDGIGGPAPACQPCVPASGLVGRMYPHRVGRLLTVAGGATWTPPAASTGR